MPHLPCKTLRRATTSSSVNLSQTQIRHATFLPRPKRPYTFTQLVTLSDGSTYTQRTTSPAPVFKSTKDTRNHILWNPSLSSLRNVEEDEAGRLRAFRKRFGRGWDVEGAGEEAAGEDGAVRNEKGEGAYGEEDGGSLMDLISGFAGIQAETGMNKGAKGKK